MKSKGFSISTLGAKCLIFAGSPIPALSFFFSLLKYTFQSRCSFIVRPNYLSCVVCRIYWPMILKFRCVVLSLLYLGMNSKISVLLVFIYILFALSHVVRRFKSFFMFFLIFFKELSTSSKLVLSANWCTLLYFMACFRSLMNIKESNKPRSELFETLNSVKALSDV